MAVLTTTTQLRTYYPYSADEVQYVGYINSKSYYVSYKIDPSLTAANNIQFNHFVLNKNAGTYSLPELKKSGNKVQWGISQHIVDSSFNKTTHIIAQGGTIEIDTSAKNISSSSNGATVRLPKSNTPYYLVFYPADSSSGGWKIPGGNNGTTADNQMTITYSIYQDDTVQSYIYTNNTWKSAIPYIYVGGVWKQAAPAVYTSNSWH